MHGPFLDQLTSEPETNNAVQIGKLTLSAAFQSQHLAEVLTALRRIVTGDQGQKRLPVFANLISVNLLAPVTFRESVVYH
jgi:hypothetical protein